MSALVSLHHVTRYAYDRPVALGPQLIRLRPAPHAGTRIARYSMEVTPVHDERWQSDPHGNWVARCTFAGTTREFSITVDLTAELAPVNPFDFFVEPYATTYPFALPSDLAHELTGYCDAEPAGARLKAFLQDLPPGPLDTVPFLVELNARVQRTVRYITRMEEGTLTPEETLAGGAGSCRDSAWLLVQALRHLRIPARFVSGYLIQLKPDAAPPAGDAPKPPASNRSPTDCCAARRPVVSRPDWSACASSPCDLGLAASWSPADFSLARNSVIGVFSSPSETN